MRNLTIHRKKSFTASLVTMKVYIEDHDAPELHINNIPCRKLGVLKNGQIATFSIPEQEAKLFVIADSVSKEFCSDFYPLPAGSDDVHLTGKNHLNPAKGNAFLFDGVTDQAVLDNRKKNGKNGSLITVIAIIIGLVAGSLLASNVLRVEKPKTFTSHGMNITLTSEFTEDDVPGFDQCYSSKTTVVCILKDPFTLAPGLEDCTLEEYAQLVLESNNKTQLPIREQDGITYFTFENNGDDGKLYFYFCTVHKSGDAFWTIQFATPASNRDKLQDQFLDWAGTVNFT